MHIFFKFSPIIEQQNVNQYDTVHAVHVVFER